MRKVFSVIVLLIISIGVGSCVSRKYSERFDRLYDIKKTVDIKILKQDSLLNVRAIQVIDSVGLTYLTSNGRFGVLFNDNFMTRHHHLPGRIDVSLSNDSIIPNFRSIAITSNKGYGLSIGSPAYL